MYVESFAGKIAWARRPPLILDKDRLTIFISSIGAPQRKSSLLILCFSLKPTPFAGNVSKEDAPPEIRKTTWSSFDDFVANSNIFLDANKPFLSGSGWEASMIFINLVLV